MSSRTHWHVGAGIALLIVLPIVVMLVLKRVDESPNERIQNLRELLTQTSPGEFPFLSEAERKRVIGAAYELIERRDTTRGANFLRELGDSARPYLVDGLKRDDAQALIISLKQLNELAVDDEEFIAWTEPLLESTEPTVREEAMALIASRSRSASARRIARDGLHDSNEDVRREARAYFLRSEPGDASFVETMRQQIRQPSTSPNERSSLLKKMGDMKHEAAIDDIVAVHEEVGWMALRALAEIDIRDPRVVRVFHGVLQHGSTGDARYVAELIDRHDAYDIETWKPLLVGLWIARLEDLRDGPILGDVIMAIDALASCGESAREAVPILVEYFHIPSFYDENEYPFRHAVIRALDRIGWSAKERLSVAKTLDEALAETPLDAGGRPRSKRERQYREALRSLASKLDRDAP